MSARTHSPQRGARAIADLAAMLDEQMREHGPVVLRKQRHERLLDLHRVRAGGEAEPVAETRDVRVDDDAVVAPEGIAEDDVRRLASYTGKLHECVHVGWNIAAVTLHERGRHADEALRLVAEEARGPDDLLDVFLLCGGERGRVRDSARREPA